MRKPFFRSDRNKWFVVGNAGKFVPLDEDEEKAFDIWNQMRERSRLPGDPKLTVMALCGPACTMVREGGGPIRLPIPIAWYGLICRGAFALRYTTAFCCGR